MKEHAVRCRHFARLSRESRHCREPRPTPATVTPAETGIPSGLPNSNMNRLHSLLKSTPRLGWEAGTRAAIRDPLQRICSPKSSCFRKADVDQLSCDRDSVEDASILP